MKERVIEDLVYQCSEEFFGETLKPEGRQMGIEGRRLDLLFEDTHGSLLLVEIKAGEISREHVGQAGEYWGLLQDRFPHRNIRIALLGTAITPERRRYLEAIKVEVHVVSEQFLLDVAEKHGIDPDVGLPQLPTSRSQKSQPDHLFAGDRFPVTDEATYFRLIDQISDEGVKEKLVAVYAVAKKSQYLRISFTGVASAELTIEGLQGNKAKILKVGVSFKRRPPKGIITLHWQWMLMAFPREKVQSFRDLVDELRGRPKTDVYLATARKEKGTTYDSIDLHDGRLDEPRFARFLEGIENLAQELSR